MVAFMIFAFVSILDTLSGQTIYVTERIVRYDESPYKDYTVAQMMDMGFEFPLVTVKPNRLKDLDHPPWLNGWVYNDTISRAPEKNEERKREIMPIYNNFVRPYFNLTYTMNESTVCTSNSIFWKPFP